MTKTTYLLLATLLIIAPYSQACGVSKEDVKRVSKEVKVKVEQEYQKIEKDVSEVVVIGKEYTDKTFSNLPVILPILSQTQWLKYLETVTKSSATKFDKAMDAGYLQTRIGGGNHRMFDGGHTIGGAWKNISEMCTKTGCSNKEQVNGYFGALWKDMTTPKGLPFMNMEKQTYDKIANKLSSYGVNKKWTYDALSYDAMEIMSAGISAAAVVYFLNTDQVEELSEALGAMGITAIVSGNPVLALVMIASVAYAIATGKDLSGKAMTEGVVKTAIVSGAMVIVPGAFLLQITAAVAISILLEKNMNDQNYEFVKEYALEQVDILKNWEPDVEGIKRDFENNLENTKQHFENNKNKIKFWEKGV